MRGIGEGRHCSHTTCSPNPVRKSKQTESGCTRYAHQSRSENANRERECFYTTCSPKSVRKSKQTESASTLCLPKPVRKSKQTESGCTRHAHQSRSGKANRQRVVVHDMLTKAGQEKQTEWFHTMKIWCRCRVNFTLLGDLTAVEGKIVLSTAYHAENGTSVCM